MSCPSHYPGRRDCPACEREERVGCALVLALLLVAAAAVAVPLYIAGGTS